MSKMWFVALYLFVAFPLSTSSTLFASIASTLGQEIVRPPISIFRAANNHSCTRDMKYGYSTTEHELFSRELAESSGEG